MLAAAGLAVGLGPMEASPLQRVLAFAVFATTTAPAIAYWRRETPNLPFLPLMALLYGTSYGLALFTNPAGATGEGDPGGSQLTGALLASLIGVCALELGFRFGELKPVQAIVPNVGLALDPHRTLIVLTPLVVVSLVRQWSVGLGLTETPLRWQALLLLMLLAQRAFLVVLAIWVFEARVGPAAKTLFWALLAADALQGVVKGMLSETIVPIMLVASVYWMTRRRFPIAALLVSLVLVAVLQDVKGAWRAAVWQKGEVATVGDRLSLWFELAEEGWGDASRDTEERRTRLSGLASRFDNLQILTRVVSMTPQQVDFQSGATYRYLLVAWIPRAVWPDKPVAHEANDWFAVTYGFLQPSQVGETMVGMPHLVEAFVNFGWPGVPLVMLAIGCVYSILDRMFNHSSRSEGSIAILAVLMLGPTAIESATAATFGAVLQNAVALLAIFLPVRSRS